MRGCVGNLSLSQGVYIFNLPMGASRASRSQMTHLWAQTCYLPICPCPFRMQVPLAKMNAHISTKAPNIRSRIKMEFFHPLLHLHMVYPHILFFLLILLVPAWRLRSRASRLFASGASRWLILFCLLLFGCNGCLCGCLCILETPQLLCSAFCCLFCRQACDFLEIIQDDCYDLVVL